MRTRWSWPGGAAGTAALLFALGCSPSDEGMGTNDGSAAADLGGSSAPDGGSGDGGADPCLVVRCSAGYVCQAGTCTLNQDATWVLTVTSGTIADKGPDGEAWDPLGGKPDAYVCLTFGGNRHCTAYKDDTLSPLWNEAFPAAAARNLLGGVLVELWDKDDVGGDDVICPATVVPITQEQFASGRWGASCQYGSFQATLRVQ